MVDLHVAFDRSTRARTDAAALAADAAAWLQEDAGLLPGSLPGEHGALRTLVTRLLTHRAPRPIPSDRLAMLDALFACEAEERRPVHLEEVLAGPPGPRAAAHTQLQLWRGDITTLAVDAIVNAANADMLGCFRPEHRCIDNAIHAAAGPRLREDCRRIMDLQGHKEPTGTAKVTRAYYLPSRFVLHTVGPIVRGGAPTTTDRQLLASCYESCLTLAADVGARSLAFCAVSTGVFGYPKEDAAMTATTTVRSWLEQHPGTMDAVIFNVFGADDEYAYRRTGIWQ